MFRGPLPRLMQPAAAAAAAAAAGPELRSVSPVELQHLLGPSDRCVARTSTSPIKHHDTLAPPLPPPPSVPPVSRAWADELGLCRPAPWRCPDADRRKLRHPARKRKGLGAAIRPPRAERQAAADAAAADAAAAAAEVAPAVHRLPRLAGKSAFVWAAWGRRMCAAAGRRALPPLSASCCCLLLRLLLCVQQTLLLLLLLLLATTIAAVRAADTAAAAVVQAAAAAVQAAAAAAAAATAAAAGPRDPAACTDRSSSTPPQLAGAGCGAGRPTRGRHGARPPTAGSLPAGRPGGRTPADRF